MSVKIFTAENINNEDCSRREDMDSYMAFSNYNQGIDVAFIITAHIGRCYPVHIYSGRKIVKKIPDRLQSGYGIVWINPYDLQVIT